MRTVSIQSDNLFCSPPEDLLSDSLLLLPYIAAEFTARTGFGNAVALLQIKGLC